LVGAVLWCISVAEPVFIWQRVWRVDGRYWCLLALFSERGECPLDRSFPLLGIGSGAVQARPGPKGDTLGGLCDGQRASERSSIGICVGVCGIVIGLVALGL
jgi:hypothetical protein